MNSPSIELVPFHEHHQPGIDAMLEGIAAEFPDNIFSPAYKKISEVYTLPGRYYWVAVAGDNAIGTVGIVVVDNFSVLKAMFLGREYRSSNEDVARHLLQKAMDGAVLAQSEWIYLGTMTQFKAAQRFYEKNGFSRIEEAALPAGYPGNNMDTVFYAYKLT